MSSYCTFIENSSSNASYAARYYFYCLQMMNHVASLQQQKMNHLLDVIIKRRPPKWKISNLLSILDVNWKKMKSGDILQFL